MADEITVALSFDEGYAEQATVMLYSLLTNNQKSRFCLYVFYNDLKDDTKKRITSNLSAFKNFTLHWVAFDKSLTRDFEIGKGHVNAYTYTRIFIPQMLGSVDRLLYLDCDMLVMGDVAALWQTALAGKTLAAVEDLSTFKRHADLQMPETAMYFNAGVLLIDAKKWRAKSCSHQVSERLVELGGKAAWWDQDGLNSVLHGDWLPLAKKWNVQSHDIFVAQEQGVKNLYNYLLPQIVHFTGNLKPWNYKSSSPFKKEYYRYLNQTNFKHTHKPQNRTPINVARRTVRNMLVKTGFLKY